MLLKGKTVVVGVTGGIAVFKTCQLVSDLKKLGANVFVVMTQNATKFVAPLTFEILSNNEVCVDTFEKHQFNVEHISLAQKADLFVVVPATANLISKFAVGVCDDMLTTTLLAVKCQIIICPAMNTAMYENEIIQQNIKKLTERGVSFIAPDCGRLACGDVGAGKLAPINVIVDGIIKTLKPNTDFAGKTVIVTAGPTREYVDKVRYISNLSSGKMGVEIAKAFYDRGAKVILIAGNLSVDVFKGVYKQINVETTQEMFEAVMENIKSADIIVKSAAPADYKLETVSQFKLKESEVNLKLVKNVDIAKSVGAIKGDKKLIIFSAETNNLAINAKQKLVSKNADMVVANDVTLEGAGFNVDTNIVSVFTRKKEFNYDIMPKAELAHIILEHIKNDC